MADSWLTRPIGELPFTKASWWTTPTPRPEGYVEPPRVLGSGAAADALGRIKTKELAQQAQAQVQQDFLSTPPLDLSRPKTAQEAVDAEVAGLIPNDVDGVPPMLERPAEQVAPPVQQRALQASQARYAAAIPSSLQGQYGGTYFGPDYEAAVASGKFTPQQVAAAEAAKARYAGTPLGLTAQRLGLESEARKADITYAGKEQEALALAAERENTARQAAEVSDRAQMKRFERMRSDFDASQAQRMRDMEDLRGEIAATKIDPSQYFSKGNAFGNVLSLLSVALGGFAEGYSGGRLKNNALAMLQNSIAQDIEAQKANLANKRGALSESQSLYGLARQKFGDDQTAMEYTRARQNELLKNQALRFANEGRTDAIRANAQKLAQHFDIESKMSDNRVMQLFADAETARLRAAAGAAAASKTAEERALDKDLALRTKLAGLRKTEAEADKLAAEALAGPAERNTARVVFEGQTYVVPKEGAKELQEMAASAAASKAQADAAIALGEGDYYSVGVEKPARSRGKKTIESLQASYAKVLSSGYNPSQVSEERARESITEPPRVLGQKAWSTGLRQIPELSADLVRKRLEAVGAVPLDQTAKAPPVKTYSSKK